MKGRDGIVLSCKIEHDPWLPTEPGGINSQKIAIVGYSHYVEGKDSPSLTNETLQSFVDGKHNFQFFRKIQGYFEFADNPEFWNRVVFFNFIPESVGSKEDKYARGTEDQLQRGRERFLRIINEQKPDKVFVFTAKGWRDFPEATLEELAGGACTPLLEGRKEPNWGTYELNSHRVFVCGFRHPQFAANEDMREQVQTFLHLRP